MEEVYKECATEMLVDLKDDCKLLNIHCNGHELQKSLARDDLELNVCIKNENNNSYVANNPSDQTILDMSPYKIDENFGDLKISMPELFSLKMFQGNNSEDGCPTAVLVDVPIASNFPSNVDCTGNKDFFKKGFQLNINKFKASVSGNQDLKGKMNECLDLENCSDSKHANVFTPEMNEKKNEVSVIKSCWKIPSPQSMSHISKEAYKVIHNLNSSIFNEDAMLIEETLPIPINFDILDLDENAKQEAVNSSDCETTNDVLSVCVPTQEGTIKVGLVKEVDDDHNPVDNSSGKVKNILSEPTFEKNNDQVKMENSPQYDNYSKKSFSFEMNREVLSNSSSSVLCDEADDVFVTKDISSEDKENIHEKENKILIKENKLNPKTTFKSNLTKPKFEQRNTLRNVSNIKCDASSKFVFPAINKNLNTPVKSDVLSTKVKKIHDFEKVQMKKAEAVVSQHSFRMTPRSSSFHFQNTKELISSAKKQFSTINESSVCRPISSDQKHPNLFSKMKTPSKRYSISTPLKSALSLKAPLTPAMNSHQTPGIPRHTPQSARMTRLSFSRSLQPSSNNLHFPLVKGLKQQNSSSGVIHSSTPRTPFGIISSSKNGKQSFSQSLSAVPSQSFGKNAMSTSSKLRFCSKLNLPSPLPAEQEKNLARALFPSVRRK